MRGIVGHRLARQPGKCSQVEPRFSVLIPQEVGLPRRWQGVTVLVPADPLGFQFEVRNRGEIAGFDPKLAYVGPGKKLSGDIVKDHRRADFVHVWFSGDWRSNYTKISFCSSPAAGLRSGSHSACRLKPAKTEAVCTQ